MPLLPLVAALPMALAAPMPVMPVSPLPVEAAVLFELNRARSDPASFARSLREWRGMYRGRMVIRPGAATAYRTVEGVAPVDEAIAFVEARRGGHLLRPAPVLAAAAADHQAEQGADGAVGHGGHNGSTPAERVQRRGGDRYVGEVIAYGGSDPADIVRQLVVDDGVGDRSHRRLLFDRSLRYAGVSCGSHPLYRYMCVITVGRTPDGRPLRPAG